MADCKRKTANLFDKTAEYAIGQTTYNFTITGLDPNQYYTCSTNFARVSGVVPASVYFNGGISVINGVWSDTPRTFKPDSNGEIIVYIRCLANEGAPRIIDDVMAGTIWVMVNEGSTPLPYEPYGWVRSLRKLTTSTDTITTLPADIYADGNNATVGISGNTVQSGTPTPDNPIIPEGTGDRTANLFDLSTATNEFINSNGAIIPSSDGDPYYLSDYISADNVTISVQYKETAAARIFTVGVYDSSKSFIRRDIISNNSVSYENVAYIRINYRGKNCQNIMLNLGSTALPYEPYGIEIPILSNSQTTNVYLGEVETMRKIKKLVLTGEESLVNVGENAPYRLPINDIAISSSTTSIEWYCSHYQSVSTDDSWASYDYCISRTSTTAQSLQFRDVTKGDITAFKQYLQQQYAAGTPVTIWYVLATEETSIVNEPLRKIGDYADTVSGVTIPTTTGADSFDVLTTLKPSSVSLSYTGWHGASVKEWDGSQWD